MVPNETDGQETALLLRVPGAEHSVARHRQTLDCAAADGIPAHVTLIYPFVALKQLREKDHARLGSLIASMGSFRLGGRRTSWFTDRVLYIALDDVEPVRVLMARVLSEFPDFPPYAGEIALEDVIPHLTIGHDRPLAELRDAEHSVQASLPFEDLIDQVELWSGPALAGRTEPKAWRHMRSYRLGAGSTLGR